MGWNKPAFFTSPVAKAWLLVPRPPGAAVNDGKYESRFLQQEIEHGDNS